MSESEHEHEHAGLRMEPELTIYHAARIRQVLQDALDETGSLVLDLSDVREIDSAGIQLLLAALGAAHARGGNVRLHGHSPVVIETFELFDLNTHFGDPLSVQP